MPPGDGNGPEMPPPFSLFRRVALVVLLEANSSVYRGGEITIWNYLNNNHNADAAQEVVVVVQ
jgi:hypothetical protein